MHKILIAEDHEMTAEIMQLHLKKKGYEVIPARTGREALAILEVDPDVSVVVTDLMMPEISGFDLLSEMKNHLEWVDIPVIVTSARAEPETVMKAAQLGCRQFMVKPVHAAELVSAVDAAIAEQPTLLRGREQVTEQLGIDSETYDHLVERLTEMVQSLVGQIQATLTPGADEAAASVFEELSRLVEAANLLGAESLSRIVDKLGQQVGADGESGADLSHRRLLLRELKLLLRRIEAGDATQERNSNASTLSQTKAGPQRQPMRKRVVRVSY